MGPRLVSAEACEPAILRIMFSFDDPKKKFEIATYGVGEPGETILY